MKNSKNSTDSKQHFVEVCAHCLGGICVSGCVTDPKRVSIPVKQVGANKNA
ncbi:hypothetical protein [Vibrio sp. R78045]|uniref:hypothetical protein n=1 Tax=Vibrio sp. R78045 TaxID=3093868 RepID=UPI0036F4272E